MELSVCLIVKNEEKVLERCLACAKKIADEIIVVDTGSTDKTKQIAKKFTNFVYDFKWCDDFSLARNFSFQKASKNYVMWLDADDVIFDEDVKKIQNLKQNLSKDTYMLKYSMQRDGGLEFCFFRERILKNTNQAVWQGFVHEAISPFGKVEFVDITIHHQKIKIAEPKRNLKIYQKHLRRGEKLSSRAQYYYAKELFFNAFYKKCVVQLTKFLKMPNKFPPNVLDAYLTLSKCFVLQNDYDKALSVLFESLKNIEPNSEILCEIGDIFAKKSNFVQAIIFYESACLLKPNYESGQFVDKNFYHLFPHLNLTMLYYKIGDYKNAQKNHVLAKLENPNHPSVLFNEKFFN